MSCRRHGPLAATPTPNGGYGINYAMTSVSNVPTLNLIVGRTGNAALAVAIILASLLGLLPVANAIPSMGRQTGYACSRCHTVFPELTPFGRQFKVGAYAMSSQKWDERPWLEHIPVAAALQISQSNTSNTTAGGAMPADFGEDRQLLLQTLALYYGGKITKYSGALVQFNYDGIERRWAMEMFDVRYAREFTISDKEVTFGATLNNSPSVSDIYNSTPTWAFPHAGSTAPQMLASTAVDMALASQVRIPYGTT